VLGFVFTLVPHEHKVTFISSELEPPVPAHEVYW